MDMNDSISFINVLLCRIPGFEEFIVRNGNIKDFEILIDTFRKELVVSNSLDYNADLLLKIAKEKYAIIVENSGNGINYLNTNVQIDDRDILVSFYYDTKNIYTPDYEFKKAEKQHYKTITEKIIFQKVNYTPEIIEKYMDCYHPYVCSKIALAFLNAKSYDIGLTFLHKSLISVFRYPNIYWDSPEAIYGCVDALYEFQHLLGPAGLDAIDKYLSNGRLTILKMLYLYLSRAIYMLDSRLDECEVSNSEKVPNYIIQKINYLSLRADLIYDYSQEFAMIFGFGVNPDIQFMADKASVYALGQQFCLEIITLDCWNDALKMYRYGALVPNSTGGYQDIEDKTFGELVSRGNYRGEQIANQLLKCYNGGEFVITKPNLSDCMLFLKDKVTSSLDFAISESNKRTSFERIQHDYWLQKRTNAQNLVLGEFRNQLHIFKAESRIIKKFLTDNGVTCFYHFTDRENLESIKRYGVLSSWKYCENNNIQIPKQGGNFESIHNDIHLGLEDYVRLSFCSNHPMTWRLKCSGYNLVLLIIKIDVAWAKDTLFSNMNATDYNHVHGGTFEDLKKVDISATKQKYVSRDSAIFKLHQAEVLVKTAIPVDYIVNIDNPISL